MGFFSELSEILFLAVNAIPTENSTRKNMKSNAQIEEIYRKKMINKEVEMEFVISKETDPMLKRKLERRLINGVYEWEDLYIDIKAK